MDKIDFVITWVDGNDPIWKAERERYSSEQGDNRDIRYRNWDNLQYWFRGVEKYAQWVNKIHFITYGHVPSWLNVQHPKLNIVKHEDFIPKEYLPTFNSRTIEWNFHRIPDLQESFVYFNDDIFILNKLRPNDFFYNHKPKDSFVLDLIQPEASTYMYMLFNNMVVLNQCFNKRDVVRHHWKKILSYKYGGKNLLRTLSVIGRKEFTGIYNHHTYFVYKKSSFEKMWKIEREKIEQTCKNKFRDKNDINHFLCRYIQLVSGEFIPSKPLGTFFTLHQNNQKIYNFIVKQIKPIICINDGENIDFEKIKNELNNSFKTVFKDKSKFEI